MGRGTAHQPSAHHGACRRQWPEPATRGRRPCKRAARREALRGRSGHFEGRQDAGGDDYYNDSITVLSGGYGDWSSGTDLDLRPGKSNPAQAGVPGGEYPFWVVVKGSAASATAYI